MREAFPETDNKVMPLWLPHSDFDPLPLNRGRITPVRQSQVIVLVSQALTNKACSAFDRVGPPFFSMRGVILQQPGALLDFNFPMAVMVSASTGGTQFMRGSGEAKAAAAVSSGDGGGGGPVQQCTAILGPAT